MNFEFGVILRLLIFPQKKTDLHSIKFLKKLYEWEYYMAWISKIEMCCAHFMMTKICVLCIEYEFSVTSVLLIHSMVWPIKPFIFIHCQHEFYICLVGSMVFENPHACHFISIWFDRCNTYYFMFLFLFLILLSLFVFMCMCGCLDEFLFLTLRCFGCCCCFFVLLSYNFVPSVLSIDFK